MVSVADRCKREAVTELEAQPTLTKNRKSESREMRSLGFVAAKKSRSLSFRPL